MKVIRSDSYSIKIRRTNPRFGFRYFDYVVTVQKVKAQDRDVNIRPQEYKMRGLLYRRVSHRRLSRRALCFLSVLSRLLRGVVLFLVLPPMRLGVLSRYSCPTTFKPR